MADIASTDVTYTAKPYPITPQLQGRVPRYVNQFTVAFGNGVLTYPAGGIPMLARSLGMPSNALEKIEILDWSDDGSPSGLWTWDDATNALRGFDFAGAELSGAVAATSLVVEATGY